MIHKTGIPLFRYDFDDIHAGADSSLVSGAITAISAIMTEAFNTTTDLKTINFHDKHLMLEFTENLACILITPHITPFLRVSMKRFTDNFVTKYEKELSESVAEVDKFEGTDEIVLNSFGLTN